MDVNTPNANASSALTALANGMIPPDERDAGAACVNAGVRLAEKLGDRSGESAAANGVGTLYRQGLHLARDFAARRFNKTLEALAPNEMHKLIADLRSEFPAFYKQLRMDVSAMYLSDPVVWQRIGFPGPSTAAGGYPDFDQPQT
jgi:hypothetical protein